MLALGRNKAGRTMEGVMMVDVLSGKTALVTGGGTGIGRATARRLAEMGATVVLNGRREKPLRETASAIEAAGGRALVIAGDVSRESEAGRIVAEAIAGGGGRLDILVNNAAVVRQKPFLETTADDYRAVLDTNLIAVASLCRAAIPRMPEGGAIVNLATGAAIRAVPGYAAYGASKAALIYLTRVLALECAPRKIRVNVVSPGSVDTPLHATFLSPKEVADLPRSVAEWTPLGRMAKPEEIASAIAYLVSPEASYITGINFSVDGGSTAA
jgi:NAD(P)-dependent dehydrogenase (short-subunit alcohol dehydrogenase family)